MLQRTRQTTREDMPRYSRERPPDEGIEDRADRGRPRAPRAPAPSQFDLVVTFEDDQHARDALLALRRRGFGPNQAVLLTRGPLAQDEFELALDELRRESWDAFSIVVATELMLGILIGAVVGWLAGLFHFAPQIGPVWIPILIVGGIGFLCAAVVAIFEFFRWRREHLPTAGEAAVALRLRGRDAPDRLISAQEVLAQFGGLHSGQHETG